MGICRKNRPDVLSSCVSDRRRESGTAKRIQHSQPNNSTRTAQFGCHDSAKIQSIDPTEKQSCFPKSSFESLHRPTKREIILPQNHPAYVPPPSGESRLPCDRQEEGRIMCGQNDWEGRGNAHVSVFACWPCTLRISVFLSCVSRLS